MPSRLYSKCFGRAQRPSPTNTHTNPDLSLKKQTSSANPYFRAFAKLVYFCLINPPLKLLCFLQLLVLYIRLFINHNDYISIMTLCLKHRIIRVMKMI